MKLEGRKMHSFADFGLWVSLCGLQLYAMCIGSQQITFFAANIC